MSLAELAMKVVPLTSQSSEVGLLTAELLTQPIDLLPRLILEEQGRDQSLTLSTVKEAPRTMAESSKSCRPSRSESTSAASFSKWALA